MLTVVAPPETICDRPTESIPQFTSNLSDGLELFSGMYPLEIEFQSEHPMKEIRILINDVFYRSIALDDAKDGKAKAEFGMSINDGVDQTVTLSMVDTYGFSSSRNYRVKILDQDVTPPVVVTENPQEITITAGTLLTLAGTIQDTSNISKIQIFVDDIIYGTLQDVKKYSFSLRSPSEIDIGNHSIKIQVTDFQKNITTHVHTVTVKG